MRLVLTSDLHIDHHPEVIALVAERARRLEADVLVVAGDLSSHIGHLEDALARLRELSGAPRAVFVPGNHDLWCLAGSPSSRERYHVLIPELARRAGFDPIGHHPFIIHEHCFVGVTGWYDYSLRNRELDGTFTMEDYRRGAWGRLRWNDKARIDWRGDDGAQLDDEAICDGQVSLLTQQLAQTGGLPTVVVTHHLPFVELRTSSGEPPWDFLNGFMGSARLGEAIRATPGVRLTVCGHTHFRKSHVFDTGLRAEISPVGYPREYKRGGRDLATRVEERVTLIEI